MFSTSGYQILGEGFAYCFAFHQILDPCCALLQIVRHMSVCLALKEGLPTALACLPGYLPLVLRFYFEIFCETNPILWLKRWSFYMQLPITHIFAIPVGEKTPSHSETYHRLLELLLNLQLRHLCLLLPNCHHCLLF